MAKKAQPINKTDDKTTKSATTTKKASTAKKTSAKSATTAKKESATKKTSAKSAATAKKESTTKKTSTKSTTTAKKESATKKTSTKSTAAAKKESATKKTNTKSTATAKKESATKKTNTKSAATSNNTNSQSNTGYPLKEGEAYMNDAQLQYFRDFLNHWKQEIIEESERTKEYLKDENTHTADLNDRASQEEEFSLELRTRDRQRKLMHKINKALERISLGDFGYCEQCGEEIGFRRLEARPTAELCIDCKQIAERKERGFFDER